MSRSSSCCQRRAEREYDPCRSRRGRVSTDSFLLWSHWRGNSVIVDAGNAYARRLGSGPNVACTNSLTSMNSTPTVRTRFPIFLLSAERIGVYWSQHPRSPAKASALFRCWIDCRSRPSFSASVKHTVVFRAITSGLATTPTVMDFQARSTRLCRRPHAPESSQLGAGRWELQWPALFLARASRT